MIEQMKNSGQQSKLIASVKLNIDFTKLAKIAHT
jgi:hypothetical protein